MAYPSRMRVALKFSPLARTTYRRMRPWASASSLAGISYKGDTMRKLNTNASVYAVTTFAALTLLAVTGHA